MASLSMLRKLLLILVLFAPQPLFAEQNVPASRIWEPAGFAGSGYYPAIVTDWEEEGTAYVISDVAGTFKTESSGDNWYFINEGVRSYIGSSIAQSKLNPDVLYTLGTKITKSTDRGDYWQSCGDYLGDRPDQHKVIAISQVDENIVFVGLANGKVIRTENGCETWEEYATPFGGTGISFVRLNKDDTYLYVGGEGGSGMKRYDLSDDSVDTITLTGTNANYNWDYDTYDVGATEHFCVTAGLKIACTSDDENWTYTEEMLVNNLYIVNTVDTTYLANTNVRFLTHLRRISSAFGQVYNYRSVDTGSTWTEFSANKTNNFTDNPPGEWGDFGNMGRIFEYACDHVNENVCYATGGTLWHSDDGGLNWVEKVHGAQNTVTTSLATSPAYNADGDQYVFQGNMDAGVLRSADAGRTWEQMIPHTSVEDPQGFDIGGHYWVVKTRGTTEEWQAGTGQVIATSSWWDDLIPRVNINSANGTGDWTIVQDGLPTTKLNGSAAPHKAAWGNGYPRAMDVCPANDDIIVLGIDGYSATENGGVFISDDGGASFERTTQPDQWRIYNAIAFDPTDTDCDTIVFAEWFVSSPYDSKSYRTTDRGVTWSVVDPDQVGVFEMAFGSDGKGYKTGLSANPTVFNSSDGITWAVMELLNFTNQLADAVYVDPDNPNVVFVGVNDGADTGPGTGPGKGAGAVYVTPNAQAGANAQWYNITGNLPSLSGVLSITKVHYDDQDWLMIATDGANVWRLPMDDTFETIFTGISFVN